MADDEVDEVDELSKLFQLATNFVRSSTCNFNQDQLLYLYARFKQANEGPCSSPKPGMFDFQGKKKWEAWKSLGNKNKEEAKREYISKVKTVVPGWDLADKKQQGDGWVAVSTMSNTESVIKDENKTAFDWCKEGDTAHLLQYLKKSKTDVNNQDENGMTLLHWTCDRGNLDMLNALLGLDADPNIQDTCHVSTGKMFKDNELFVSRNDCCLLTLGKDSDGQSALHYAVSCEHQEIVERLLKTKVSLELQDGDGLTVRDIDTNSQIKHMLNKCGT